MGRVVAEALTYPDLVDALRARRLELGITLEQLEVRAGMQVGYAAKIELGRKASIQARHKHMVRNLGWKSLPTVLGALGVRLALVEVDEAPKQERAA